ncbi:MAG TPA: 6-phosphogluconolactonase [Gemmatimonadaceae bacterium]|nr:6-phosphogluconolactonase [Gemmatimonadaceae bacterium]
MSGAVTAQISIERDPAAVAYAAAHEFWRAVDLGLVSRATFRVALAGGHTPAGMYHEIVRQRPTGAAWSKLHFFFGDERGVPPDHADSNYRMAKSALFDHAPIGSGQIHRMQGEVRPLENAARGYERELAGEPLDLVLLGIGSDGHTASLFPGSSALREATRWVLDAVAPPGNAVRERLTITLPCIAQAHDVWFMVTGSQKARTVERIHREPPDPQVPASMVKAPRIVWFLDKAAAALLKA